MNVIRGKKNLLYLIREKLWSYITVEHAGPGHDSFTQQRYSSADRASELWEDICSSRTRKNKPIRKRIWGKAKLFQSAFSPEDTLFFYLRQLRSIKSQPPHLGMDPQGELYCRTDLPGFWVFICHKKICPTTVRKRNYDRIHVLYFL